MRADYTFSGSPEGTVAEITDALRLRRKVAALAATAPAAPGGEPRSRLRTAVDLEETLRDPTGPVAELDLPDIQGLVRDLAARLITEFAGNLDRRLSGPSPGDAIAAELNGMALVFSLLRARVARWVGRFVSNKDGAT